MKRSLKNQTVVQSIYAIKGPSRPFFHMPVLQLLLHDIDQQTASCDQSSAPLPAI